MALLKLVTESLLLLLKISCKGGRELELFPLPVSGSTGEEARRDALGGREEEGAAWGDTGMGIGACGGIVMPWNCCACAA